MLSQNSRIYHPSHLQNHPSSLNYKVIMSAIEKSFYLEMAALCPHLCQNRVLQPAILSPKEDSAFGKISNFNFLKFQIFQNDKIFVKIIFCQKRRFAHTPERDEIHEFVPHRAEYPRTRTQSFEKDSSPKVSEDTKFEITNSLEQRKGLKRRRPATPFRLSNNISEFKTEYENETI